MTSEGNGAYFLTAAGEEQDKASRVMHRISYDGGPFRAELNKAVINAMNQEIREMCRRLDFTRQEI